MCVFWEVSSFDCCHFWLWGGFWEKRWLLLHLPAMITFHLLEPQIRKSVILFRAIFDWKWFLIATYQSPPLNSFWNLLICSNWVSFFLIRDQSVFHLFLSLLKGFMLCPSFSNKGSLTTLRILIWNQFELHKLHTLGSMYNNGHIPRRVVDWRPPWQSLSNYSFPLPLFYISYSIV